MTRIISAPDIALLADLPLLMDSAEQAFLAVASGSAQVPARLKFPLDGTENRLIAMPAHLVDDAVLLTKVLTVCPGNRRQAQPTISGVAILVDARCGAVR